MIKKIIDKLTSSPPWRLFLFGVLLSEITTLFFSIVFSFILWGHMTLEVLVIGIIDAFLVAMIIMIFTSMIVNRIRITEITNEKLLKEIEERKAAEAETKRLERQLRQAQKMEAIGTLAGGIAHDFNNILAAMLGYSEMVKEQLPPEAPSRKDIDHVITGGNRAVELVKQILTFSRQGDENLQPLKVQPIINETLKLLRASLPTTINLQENIDTNCRQILADPTQIHQVLMNLCTNAKQAIGTEFGTLGVSLTEINVTAASTVKNCPHIPYGDYLCIEISDTGCGVGDAIKAQIFDPFFTTKEPGQGSGLGLSVVHGIIKQHHGEITISSEPGQGTTFHIYLPVIFTTELVPENHTTEHLPQGNGQHILFVDDELAIGNLMERVLKTLGYRVTAFSSSIEALAAFKILPSDFDLVITDMTMPDMTGIDLAREIFDLQTDIPVILCTGFSEAVDKEMAESLGICEFIIKPVEREYLAKAISEALKS